MASVLSASQAGAKYGIPASDPGSSFAKNAFQGTTRVLPYAEQNRTTVGRRTSWESQLGTGPGSFINFGDNNPQTNLPTPAGA